MDRTWNYTRFASKFWAFDLFGYRTALYWIVQLMGDHDNSRENPCLQLTFITVAALSKRRSSLLILFNHVTFRAKLRRRDWKKEENGKINHYKLLLKHILMSFFHTIRFIVHCYVWGKVKSVFLPLLRVLLLMFVLR